MGLILPVSPSSSLHSHTCCHSNHLPCLLPQLCPTCLQIFPCPYSSFSILAVSFLSFFKAVSAKHFACTLYHCPIITLIQSKSHSHRTTSSTPFALTLIYISRPSVPKSDLSYTDASLSLKFLFRRLIFELYFLRNVGKIYEQKMSIKSIKPDKTGECLHSVINPYYNFLGVGRV